LLCPVVTAILKDFGLHFKNIKNLFLARKYIIYFYYKDKKPTKGIISKILLEIIIYYYLILI
jgi:hypothetical protein